MSSNNNKLGYFYHKLSNYDSSTFVIGYRYLNDKDDICSKYLGEIYKEQDAIKIVQLLNESIVPDIVKKYKNK